MPINLITGLPGHGKTLYLCSEIYQRLKRENDELIALGNPPREIFYNGIPDLRLPWIQIEDPALWFELPVGSICIIDEAQRIFPLRSSSSPIPKKCSQFETHRHRGMDIYLLTQNQSYIDHHVRNLIDTHHHLNRPYGVSYANVLQFQGAKNPDNKADRNMAIKTKFNYPTDAFSNYKSSELHTIKRRLPWKKLLLLPACMIAIVGLIYAVYEVLLGDVDNDAIAASTTPGIPITGVQDYQLTALTYADQRTPRIAEIPESAPVYDELAQPVDFPRLSACIDLGSSCTCHTQQGTPLAETSLDTCRNIAKNGVFDPYLAPPRFGARAGGSARARPAPVASQSQQQLINSTF